MNEMTARKRIPIPSILFHFRFFRGKRPAGASGCKSGRNFDYISGRNSGHVFGAILRGACASARLALSFQHFHDEERAMNKDVHLHLQHSEAVVAGMAATIFAGYLQSRQISENNEDAYLRKAVDAAIRMAGYVDTAVRSDEEWLKTEDKTSSML
ncbi:MAG TPA: hypothetical protein VJ698_19535 [Noviherbaspirillum sp.]|uniref:hypothetical protein n=1 Tax=Noviherbaspirillum sp. TaxID=1926288 RepID=UPI002B465272|nr:hypothetical protein [Noviherbaspirillum sp.]HJV87671.1 hypothetical protein [Noviherbaspirillum sp.]